MKKVLGIVLTALCVGSALAQITITQNNAPGVGMTMSDFSTSSDVNWSPGSGSNQTWNIASFSYSLRSTSEYISPSGTPYENEFPTASHCVNSGGEGYTYYRVANNGIYLLGFGTIIEEEIFVQRPDQEVLIVAFPCTMGTTWTSVMRFTTEPIPGHTYVMLDSSIYTVDGWGTLTTPDWTEAALRFMAHGWLKYFVDGQQNGVTVEDWGYNWVTANGGRGASYSNPDATGPGFTTGEVGYTTTGTVDVDPIRGPVAENFKLSQNYPNPFNPNTNLPIELAKSAKVELTIYNEVGQVVSTMSYDLSAGQHNLPIDGSAWSAGSYFANVKAGDEAQTTRMLLVK